MVLPLAQHAVRRRTLPAWPNADQHSRVAITTRSHSVLPEGCFAGIITAR